MSINSKAKGLHNCKRQKDIESAGNENIVKLSPYDYKEKD